MITSNQGGKTSFSNFKIRTPFRRPRCLGWGDIELANEVDFVFVFLLLFCVSPFCNVQWLAGFPFYKAVIPNNLLFQNLEPFCNQNFCVVPSP